MLLPGLGPESRGWAPDGLEPRRWTARLLPAKMWRSVTADGARDFDANLADHFRGLHGAEREALRHRLAKWPCLIGLRIATLLIDRGRIAVAVVDSPRDAHKLRTARPSSWDDEAWGRWLEEHVVVTGGES